MTLSSPQTEVLIVGAGPTGLVLALWLKRLGVEVRIVDKTSEPGTTSRALAVHARTLEFYRQIGLADDVVERGLKFAAINLWARGEHAGRVDFADIGEGLSPFPYILIFPQDLHEQLLIERLRRAGVEVERPTRLIGFEERGDRVVARMEREGGAVAECEAAYIAGCDSAHSKVREVLGIEFPGGTYDRVFYVADVALRGRANDRELHIALDDADLAAIFPMKGDNAARLIGTVKRGSEEKHADLTWSDVSQNVVERIRVTVDQIHWFSSYRVHHRVAEHFGRGRAFLLGDAAHIHSPVGGQGMNTGIGDAVNLAWKLAAVLRRRASASLLDSYEPERIAFARRLVATTDRAFTLASEDGPLSRYMRLDAIPLIAPRLAARKAVRRFMFKTVSQILVNYRRGPLSEGKAGSVRGGDRLPWVAPAGAGGPDNFAPLASLDWQVHVHGDASRDLLDACARRGLPMHAFPWRAGAGKAGFAPSAVYLVRPDGYVALADGAARPAMLEKYLDARGIRASASR
ncbi:MAG: FAD-dependent monooxygenase [Polyangiaceae bacterium]|jgi:2-polyprenyl-6-methoxyphenol hydroxylase-like FAD-dependent oxidoreductase